MNKNKSCMHGLRNVMSSQLLTQEMSHGKTLSLSLSIYEHVNQ